MKFSSSLLPVGYSYSFGIWCYRQLNNVQWQRMVCLCRACCSLANSALCALQMLAVIRKLFSRNKLQANIQLVPWRVGSSWKKEAAGYSFV